MGEAKPTPGAWLLELSPDGGWCIFVEPNVDMGAHKTIASRGQWNHNIAESHANAALFHDAGTVFHTTGLTPSQLVERVKEMEAVVSALIAYDADSQIEDGALMMLEYAELIAAARAALSKARPNTAEGKPEAEATDGTRWNQTPCEHCGHTEGEHFNARCLHITGETRYTPAAAKEPSP